MFISELKKNNKLNIMKNSMLILILFFIAIANANSQQANVTYKILTDSNASMDYKVSVTYSQIDFGPEALMGVQGIASDINNVIDTMVSGNVKRFVIEVSQMPEKTVNGNGSSLDISSDANIVNGMLFTGQLTVFSNIAGMAHPMTTIQSFNFNLADGNYIELSDLFKSSSDYLKYISDECINQLTAKAEKEGYTNINDMITSGASPNANNFSVWNIKDDNLVLTFNPYQVAPYVFGSQSVSIPLSNMTSMLEPKGPLSFMFR